MFEVLRSNPNIGRHLTSDCSHITHDYAYVRHKRFHVYDRNLQLVQSYSRQFSSRFDIRVLNYNCMFFIREPTVMFYSLSEV